MPFDGAFLCAVVSELNEIVPGSRIEKVLQPEKDELVLMLHTKQGTQRLLLSARPSHPRIQITAAVKKNPEQPPAFCMLLRKHITGARIIEIRQPMFDRIAEIVIQTRNDLQDIAEKRLIVEMMGKYSNIIFVDENDRILDCARHVGEDMSSVRELLPGVKYVLPVQEGKQDPRLLTQEKPDERGDVDAAYYYSHQFYGISTVSGKELAYIEESQKCNPVPAFMENIEKGSPVTFQNERGKPDMLPYHYSTASGEVKQWSSASELLDYFYAEQDRQNYLKQYTANMMKVLKNNHMRAEKKLANLQNDLSDVENNEQNRVFGELLTANIYLLKKGMDRVTVQNYYAEDCGEIQIPLREDLTPSENIQRYFKRYTKGKNAKNEITKQMEQTQRELEYLSGQMYHTEYCTSVEEADEIAAELIKLGYMKANHKKKARSFAEKESQPMHYRTSEGIDVFIGKNNRQNEQLTHKIARPGDIWLHTKKIPGSHVILRTGNMGLPEQSILEAARLAAYYSSGRGATKVEVDYCPKKNVQKVPGAQPGFVIYDSYYTIVVDGTQEAIEGIEQIVE